MALPDNPIELSPEQVTDLARKLSVMRHNIHNHLALVVAASELIRRKPELAPRYIENVAQQPDRIVAEIKSFSAEFEAIFGKGNTSIIAKETPPKNEGGATDPSAQIQGGAL